MTLGTTHQKTGKTTTRKTRIFVIATGRDASPPTPVDARTMVKTISPITSSMTAAARIVWATVLWTLPISMKTRAVMATLVAVRIVPRKSEAAIGKPYAAPMA